MKLHRVTAVIVRHCYETRRNVDRFMDMVYWPVLDIILWGFFTIYLAKGNHLRPDTVSFLLGAVILWGIFFAFQRDMTVGFLDELWARNMINLFSSPLSVWEYITGLICVNLVKTLVGFVCASAIAVAAYKFDIVPYLVAFLPYMLILILFAFAIGILMAGLIVRYTTRVQTLAWSFAGLLNPVSCVLYPVSSLPRALRPVAWALPTTHAFEGMRQILAGGGFSRVQFWWGMGLNVSYFAAAILFFNWIFASARNKGLLVKIE
ncbi:MAG: ABC transporter permease [Candidatus Binataceae bacterium]